MTGSAPRLATVMIVVVALGVTVALLSTAQGGLFNTRRTDSTATSSADVTPSPQATKQGPLLGNDWTQYRSNVSGDGVNSDGLITSANVATLTQQWTKSGFSAMASTPAVVGDTVYLTIAQDNKTSSGLYAFDLRTGAERWHFDAVPPLNTMVSSSVAVDPTTHLAYFGDPEARFYAVDTRTGQGVWTVQLDKSNGAHIWSSPLLVNGKVYVGVASHDDQPCVRSGIYALDPATGAILWTHYTAPAGSLGGGVWSSVSANVNLHEIIATTGNPCEFFSDGVQQGQVAADEDSILGLDWDTGATKWRYQAIAFDDCDCDFGQGPVDAIYQGQEYIVAGNKYGMIYALARNPAGGTPKLVWNYRAATLGFVGSGGIFSPPSYSDGLVYIPGGPTIDGVCKHGAVNAIHVNTGKLAWRICTNAQVVSPSAVSGNVLFVSEQDHVLALDTATGKTLAQLPASGVTFGGVSVAHGYVLIGTFGGKIFAYSLP